MNDNSSRGSGAEVRYLKSFFIRKDPRLSCTELCFQVVHNDLSYLQTAQLQNKDKSNVRICRFNDAENN